MHKLGYALNKAYWYVNRFNIRHTSDISTNIITK